MRRSCTVVESGIGMKCYHGPHASPRKGAIVVGVGNDSRDRNGWYVAGKSQ